MNPLIIGCAAGFSGDRIDGIEPVVKTLIETNGHALIFETLAERTLALAQLARNNDAEAGYEPLLDAMLHPCLGPCLEHGIRIVSNFGQANPPAAARRIRALAEQWGLRPPRIAVLAGDHLDRPEQLAYLRDTLGPQLDTDRIVSINAYQGATEVAEAIQAGADVVVAGRVADPSLVVGPAMAHFGWEATDWQSLGTATMAGHLLECGTQVTGGYFAVPGLKDVPDMHRLGYPIARLDHNGSIVISKAQDTGGVVDERTVKEQLLYELHDPARYLTPDVTADITKVQVKQIGQDQVAVSGVLGHPRPDMLKVNVFLRGGWFAEAEISYAGIQAEARARLAADTIRRRIGSTLQLRTDLIGAVSLFADDEGRLLAEQAHGHGRDIRLRMSASHDDRDIAETLLREVNALYTCGPAGGGGVRVSLKPRLNSISTFIPRDLAPASWSFLS